MVLTLNLSPNEIGNSDDETNFSHKLILIVDTFQGFVRLLQIIHQLIENYQNSNNAIWMTST